jgi:hypothetical protein
VKLLLIALLRVCSWTQNKDIHWYARDEDEASVAATKKAEEIRKIKEAEEDALAVALYVSIPPLALLLPHCSLWEALSVYWGEGIGYRCLV